MKNTFDFSWKDFVKHAPPTVRDYALRLKDTPQSTNWHPEGNVEVHTRIVLIRTYKYINKELSFAAFFHDLGKVDKTAPNDSDGYSAYDHEVVSAQLVKYSRDWLLAENINPDCVEWIVRNHMRVKFLDQMTKIKKKELVNHEWFPLLVNFSKCDSRKGVDFAHVVLAGGNPFKFWWNKIKTNFDKFMKYRFFNEMFKTYK